MTRPKPLFVPPDRDGVAASRVAVTPGPWVLLADFLAQRLDADDWPERLARGEVLDAEGRPLAPDAPAVPHTVVWYWRALPPEPRVPFELQVLHQDEHLVVVDKPHFLAVAPTGRYLQETVLVRLKRLLNLPTLVPMHRLDRETAGVLLFTVNPATRNAYQALLRERRVHKVYEAVAPWRDDLALPLDCHHRLEEPPGDGFMQMQVVAGEANAHTRIELISRLPAYPVDALDARAVRGSAPGGPTALAHYRLYPITGRRHQLRAQLNALGLPIVGDRIYPVLWPHPPANAAPDYSNPLQLLARGLSFNDPLTGQPRQFVSRRWLALVQAAAAGHAASAG
jgi:tRNA pseudouridine32 synthase/23S rRNA pseudouridine746 synthase